MPEKIIAAGGLVEDEKNRLLVIYRREKWDLPKGKLDEGETIETCAFREVEEETGLKNLELVKFLGITEHGYFDTYLHAEVIKETHWYVMKTSCAEALALQTEEDITEAKWISKNEADEIFANTYPNIIHIIKKYYGADI